MPRPVPFKRFKVVDQSMEPNFKEGDYVLVNTAAYKLRKPKVGDVVVLEKEHKKLLKRIVKIAGNEFFVEGDNKTASRDSRQFGLVSKREILGKVIVHAKHPVARY